MSIHLLKKRLLNETGQPAAFNDPKRPKVGTTDNLSSNSLNTTNQGLASVVREGFSKLNQTFDQFTAKVDQKFTFLESRITRLQQVSKIPEAVGVEKTDPVKSGDLLFSQGKCKEAVAEYLKAKKTDLPETQLARCYLRLATQAMQNGNNVEANYYLSLINSENASETNCLLAKMNLGRFYGANHLFAIAHRHKEECRSMLVKASLPEETKSEFKNQIKILETLLEKAEGEANRQLLKESMSNENVNTDVPSPIPTAASINNNNTSSTVTTVNISTSVQIAVHTIESPQVVPPATSPQTLAEQFYRQKKYFDAVKEYEKAFGINLAKTSFAECCYRCAESLIVEQKYDEALKYLDKVTPAVVNEKWYDGTPKNWYFLALLAKGNCISAQGKFNEAIAHFEECCEDLFLSISQKDVLKEKIKTCLTNLKKAEEVAISPPMGRKKTNNPSKRVTFGDDSENAISLGNAHEGKGEFLQAMRCYDRVTDIKVKENLIAECNYHWAFSSFERGLYVQAAQLLEKINPNTCHDDVLCQKALYNLGKCYEGLESYLKAKEIYEQYSPKTEEQQAKVAKRIKQCADVLLANGPNSRQ